MRVRLTEKALWELRSQGFDPLPLSREKGVFLLSEEALWEALNQGLDIELL